MKFVIRLPIFFTYVIRQMSDVQYDLANAAHAIDLASVEKRNIKSISDNILKINETIKALTRNLQLCETLRFRLEQWLETHNELFTEGTEISDWTSFFNPNGTFPLFLHGLKELTEQEDLLMHPEISALGQHGITIDRLILWILQDVVSIGFLGQSLLSTAKSYAELVSVSVVDDNQLHPLICSLRELSEKIGMLSRHIHKMFDELNSLLAFPNP